MTETATPKSFDELLAMDVQLMRAQFKKLFDRHAAGEQLRPRDYDTMDFLKSEIKRREAAPGENLTGSSASPAPKVLPNLLRVTEYLQAQGFKVKKSAVYKHAAAGLIPRATDGSYSSDGVDTYAAAHLKRLDGAPATPAATAMQTISEQSAQAELRRRQAQADLLEQKAAILSGSFISLATHEQEITARAARLWADFQNFVHADLPAIIDLVKGDPVHTPEMIEYVLASGARWFARYDSPEEFVVHQSELDAVSAILSGVDTDTRDSADVNYQAPHKEIPIL